MILEILGGLVVVVAIIYYWSISRFKFWSERGVAGPKPTVLIGNLSEILRGTISTSSWLNSFEKTFEDAPLIGYYSFLQPILIVKDLDLIKDVLISDFSKFTDRPFHVLEKSEPLSQHLFALKHAKWRPLRNKLSPIFTSGKLKDMFYLLLNCGDHLQNLIDKMVAKDNIVEANDLTTRFGIDVIGSCVFGLELDSMSDEDNDFRKIVSYVSNVNWKTIIISILRQWTPSIFEFMAPIVKEKKLTNFFVKLMNDTMKYRRQNQITTHDFIDFLMELQDNPEKIPDVELTDSLMASQLFVFFVAGFQTSSMTLNHALYELAQRQDLQDKLRDEIRKTKEENDGKFTYSSVKNMEYMDMVFKEILRMHAPAPLLLREANASYTFSGINVTIPKKQQVMISVYGIHHNPEIYPEPEKFNPENFTKEAIDSRHPMSFLPFGDGPRNCIGMRFAFQQVKVGLIKILERYRVVICDKTGVPDMDKVRESLKIGSPNQFPLKFEKI